jgi:dihydropteroate synthase
VYNTPLRLGPRTFGPGDYAVMAIVNRTPDSFYDNGATFAADAALRAVEAAVTDGADIIDIGGVKAGPGTDVGPAEERERTVPTVMAVRKRFPDVVISIDTWRAEVARAAVGAGALATVTGLARSAVERGVRPDGILIDPAHDFNKNTWQSLEISRRLDELAATGWPLLVALSNKDFVGETLDLPVDQRLEGTLAATAIAAWLGARVFRAHHVRETRRAVDMVAAIRGDRPPASARRALA